MSDVIDKYQVWSSHPHNFSWVLCWEGCQLKDIFPNWKCICPNWKMLFPNWKYICPNWQMHLSKMAKRICQNNSWQVAQCLHPHNFSWALWWALPIYCELLADEYKWTWETLASSTFFWIDINGYIYGPGGPRGVKFETFYLLKTLRLFSFSFLGVGGCSGKL